MRKTIILSQQLQDGGVEKSVILLANALVERKVDVELVSVLRSHLIVNVSSCVKIKHLTYFKAWKKNIFYRVIRKFFELFFIAIYIKKLDNVNVISTRHEYSILLSKFGKKNVLKIAQLHHDHCFKKRILRDFQYKYKNIDYFVQLTDTLCNEIAILIKNTNYKTKVITIPNFIEVKNHQMLKKENIVIAVGRFCLDKAFDRLIDIWEKVYEKNKDWKLIIVGDGREYRNIKKKVSLLNLNSSIELPKRMSHLDVLKLMHKSKIYAMTSVSESFGFVMIEAMNNYCPVVAFDVRVGPRAILDDNVNGLLIEDNNLNIFIDKLLMLMNNPFLLKTMAYNAYDKSLIFDKKVIIDSWLKILV